MTFEVRFHTRGYHQHHGHRFHGPGSESWWTSTLGLWILDNEPTVFVRRAEPKVIEAALVGLPSGRTMVDGTSISNLLVLSASVGTPNGAAVADLVARVFTAIRDGSLDECAVVTTTNAIMTGEIVEAWYDDPEQDSADRLAELAEKLRAIATPDDSKQKRTKPRKWYVSMQAPDAASTFAREAHRLSVGGHDGELLGYLSLAASSADAEAALARLPAGGVILDGDEVQEVVEFDPKAERSPAAIDQLPARRAAILAAVAVSTLMMVILLAAAAGWL